MKGEQIQEYFFPTKLTKYNFNYFIPRVGVANFLKGNLNSFHGKVLDLACGNRPYQGLIESCDQVSEYIPMDIGSEEIYKNSNDILVWDGKKIPLEDESVDFVLITEFLEHVFNTEEVLKEIKRVLKKDGLVLGTVPFIYPIHESPHDQFRFTPYSLKGHFENTGYEIQKISGLGGKDKYFAQAIAIWIHHRRSMYARVMRTFWLMKMRSLIKKDKIEDPFEEGAVFTGLGFIIKK